jgi:hypothetical protein
LSEVEQRINELKLYRKAIAETLEEWDAKGQAPGHVCGLIESSHMEEAIKPEKRLDNKKGKGG